jgi:hypothetical protein
MSYGLSDIRSAVFERKPVPNIRREAIQYHKQIIHEVPSSLPSFRTINICFLPYSFPVLRVVNDWRVEAQRRNNVTALSEPRYTAAETNPDCQHPFRSHMMAGQNTNRHNNLEGKEWGNEPTICRLHTCVARLTSILFVATAGQSSSRSPRN